MPKVTFTRTYKYAEGIYPDTYEPGEHDVSDACANAAIEEGFALPFLEQKTRSDGLEGGEGKPSPSSPPAPASPKGTRKPSRRGKAKA
ncbi:MAG: hypothetical protein JJ939_12085 [Alphaproteobacteria bacterium]|nr:hypothetical protein [Alphaproteobacteria bacterium]MBO6629152.1 hypothetical protein [Alphaproteobacteria bacterium]